ncbi:MAG: T9SS type A sorting domain-containing protein [Ignavibacteria bacterium]|nr:T9SS type A sorting domain-containing protein [Ignavibacteria bacterium]MCC7158031.1 T9SS type A sorting domain-containing protein [Ignavibacteria bacterium]
MLGREVETRVNENLKAGTYNANWNATYQSSGVYFYKLETDGYSQTRTMVLIK